MTARNATLVFIAMLTLALIATFPLRLALALTEAPLSAANVTGSVWNGHVQSAEIAGLSFQDASLALRPSALLTGSARFAIASEATLPGLPFPVQVVADVHLPGGNIFLVETRIEAATPALEERLVLMGFAAEGDHYVRRDEGTFAP
jgi:hypothetical protein